MKRANLSEEEWEVWILEHLLINGANNFVLEETLIEEAGQNIDPNFFRGMKKLKDDGIVAQIETKGQRRYGINVDEMRRARQRNKELYRKIKDAKAAQFVQPYIPQPKGYSYLGEAPEVREFKGQSIYHLFYKDTDRQCYAVRRISKTKGKYEIMYLGSLNDPNSYISRAWRIVQELAKAGNGIFILQNLVDRDSRVTSTNKIRGYAIIAVLLYERHISIAGNEGVSTKYCLHGQRPKLITLKDFVPEVQLELPDEGDFPETWEEDDIKENLESRDKDRDKSQFGSKK